MPVDMDHDWHMHPKDFPDEHSRKMHIGNICMGILHTRYPAPKGSLSVVTQEAIVKYGPRLGTQIDNMFRDCCETGRSIHYKVLWAPDGSPVIEPMNKKIIMPTDLDTFEIAKKNA